MERDFQVIEGGDPMLDGFMDAVKTEYEFEAGVRQVDMDRIRRLITVPNHGETLERIVHDFAGAGRRAPEQQAQVAQDAQVVIASIADPEVTIVDERLIGIRDRALRTFDSLADFWESSTTLSQGEVAEKESK